MRFYLDMVGCRLNQAEIDALAIDLVNRGAEIVSDPQLADTIIINTCCVTAKASADSRKMIRHYQNHSPAKVVSTGCWVSVAQSEADEISDLAYLNDQKELIPEILLRNPPEIFSEIVHKPKLGHRNRTRGFVKIQDGCNNACSFCLTTIARGPSISSKPEDILERVRQLERMDIKEIVLTGVQLGSWGKDLEPKRRLSSLLEYLLTHSQIPRIRLSSIEPWDIDQDLVNVLNHPRIMPNLHIPLQSGSDSILRKMHRPVNQERFRQVLAMIREISPQTAITTDVISGFPGETDELFEESCNFIRSCNFNGGHVFSFSPMPGTLANEMKERVHSAVIKAMTNHLLVYFAEQEKSYKQQKLGQIERVLFESRKISPQGTFYRGFTEDYQRVICYSQETLLNQIRNVGLTSLNEDGDLLGVLLPQNPTEFALTEGVNKVELRGYGFEK
jgi:threonylcarbamoyladenosine tRNA methylthiotransferase MtaB